MSENTFARRLHAVGQFRVADLDSGELDTDSRHHLFRVLRARTGEDVVLTNGHGSWRLARVADGELVLDGQLCHDEEDPPVTIYMTPLKGDRSEWAIAKCVELGVTRVVPLLSARGVVKWSGGAGDKVIARWRRIAAEAAGQCRRSRDLVLGDPVAPRDVPSDVSIAEIGATGTLDGVRSVAIGPEGGWAPDEWAPGRGTIGLGSGVLRAETAVVAAATLLVSSRAGWSRRAGGE